MASDDSNKNGDKPYDLEERAALFGEAETKIGTKIVRQGSGR